MREQPRCKQLTIADEGAPDHTREKILRTTDSVHFPSLVEINGIIYLHFLLFLVCP